MSFPSGKRLGPYEILSPLGAGGMGEVYRARDTRLGREVAVKVLPAEFADDEERLRRFEQEARAAAALNHPNILVLYDIGSAVLSSRGAEGPAAISSSPPGLPRPQGGLAVTEEARAEVHYIVTELLEGESLRERLRGGPLPPAKAVEFAIQIAQGLAAAHEKGIVHRDLKPENLFITKDGRIKILDFGLARLRPEAGVGLDQSQAATAESPTREGKVLGTPGYMAPEQVRGHAADARSDIFSFGCVLYEMLSGKRAFEGISATDVAAAILKDDPPPLPPASPPVLNTLIRRCLEKRPEDRFSTAHDLAFALEAVSGSGAAARTPTGEVGAGRSKRWFLIGGAVAATLLVAATVVLGVYFSRGKMPAPKPFDHIKVTRLSHQGVVQFVQGYATWGRAALSPDGRYVAYFLSKERGPAGLWVEQVATSSATEIVPPSDERPFGPTFSPDGNYIYYVAYPPTRAASQLYRVPVLGGAPERLPVDDVDTPVTFSPDGTRVAFARGIKGGLKELRIANLDGTGQRMVTVTTPGTKAASGPAWSPDGKTLAWTREEGRKAFIQLVDVQTGAVRRLGDKVWDDAWEVEWMPGGRRLLLTAQQQVWAVDALSGTARPITSDVSSYYSGLSVSTDGRSLASVRTETRCDIWVAPFDEPTRAAQITFGSDNLDGLAGLAWTPAGGLVYSSLAAGGADLWMMEKLGARPRRITRDGNATREVWPDVSPDGRSIVFVSCATFQDSYGAICRMDTDGSNPRQLSPGPDAVPVVSKDGRWVLYNHVQPESQECRVPIEGGRPERLGEVGGQIQEAFKNFAGVSQSPDGRLLAGWVPDSRGYTLAVVPLDGSGPRVELQAPIPIHGFIRWAPDGRSLLYEVLGRAVIYRKTLDNSPASVYLDLKEGTRCLFAISRDGKQIAYAHVMERSDVVLIRDTTGEEKQK